MKYLLTLMSVLLMFAACNKDDDNKPNEPDFTKVKAKRAIMIYMAGENNMTVYSGFRALQEDIAEMVEGSKSLADNQRVFLFVDSLCDNKEMKETPYIAEVHGGKVYSRKTFDTDFYSCDPNRFKEVISWMTENIEADGYGLVLWGHASGWLVSKDTIASNRAYGMDSGKDIGQSKDLWMNITQMAQALKGLPKMDFIFADCCNMMSAEVGYELRNATDYLIGSPSEIPGPGAPYDLLIPSFFYNGSNLYRNIIDTYYNYYTKAYNETTDGSLNYLKGYSLPMAVIETQYMEQLAQKTHEVIATFATNYPEAVNVNGIPYYLHYDSPSMYDMKAVITKQAQAYDSTVKSVYEPIYNDWLQAFKQAVPYSRMSMRWMSIYYDQMYSYNFFDQNADCGCVSMFVPQNLSNYFSGDFQYNKTANHFGWNRIVDWSRYGW